MYVMRIAPYIKTQEVEIELCVWFRVLSPVALMHWLPDGVQRQQRNSPRTNLRSLFNFLEGFRRMVVSIMPSGELSHAAMNRCMGKPELNPLAPPSQYTEDSMERSSARWNAISRLRASVLKMV